MRCNPAAASSPKGGASSEGCAHMIEATGLPHSDREGLLLGMPPSTVAEGTRLIAR